MSKKFMKLKKIIVPALTIVALLAQSSMVFATTLPTNTLDLVNNTSTIVLEVKDVDATSTMEGLVGVNTQVKATALSDINNHWGKDYINKLVNSGGIKGYPDGTFKPKNPVSSAELTAMLLASAKYEIKELKENWADNMIANGYEAGIYTSSNIKMENANKPISREVVAEVLVNTSDKLLKESTTSIDTSDGASYVPDLSSANKTYQSSIVKAYKLGLTGGGTDHKYQPKSDLNRAELSVIVCRLTGLESKLTPVKVIAPETGVVRKPTKDELKYVHSNQNVMVMTVEEYKAAANFQKGITFSDGGIAVLADSSVYDFGVIDLFKGDEVLNANLMIYAGGGKSSDIKKTVYNYDPAHKNVDFDTVRVGCGAQDITILIKGNPFTDL